MFGTKFASLATVLTMACTPLLAESPSQAIEKERLDLAGRERMLIQRIVKSSCFVLSNVSAEKYAQDAINDSNLFETTLADLIDGSPDRGWNAENNPVIRAQMESTYDKWALLRPAALQLSHGDLIGFAIAKIVEDTDVTVNAMNEAVAVMAASAQSGGLDAKTAKTLNAAGKQRMLTQKLAKEFCFLHNDVRADAHRELLKETMTTFETTLDNLLMANAPGDAFIAPPNDDAVRHLENAKRIWIALAPVIKASINAQATTRSDLENVAALSDQLLGEMVLAVNAYVAGNA